MELHHGDKLTSSPETRFFILQNGRKIHLGGNDVRHSENPADSAPTDSKPPPRHFRLFGEGGMEVGSVFFSKWVEAGRTDQAITYEVEGRVTLRIGEPPEG